MEMTAAGLVKNVKKTNSTYSWQFLSSTIIEYILQGRSAFTKVEQSIMTALTSESVLSVSEKTKRHFTVSEFVPASSSPSAELDDRMGWLSCLKKSLRSPSKQ